jgi:putative zinc finger protein
MSAWTCRRTRRVLEAFHDGELPVEQQVAVQTHLAQCTPCTTERARLAGIGATLREGMSDPMLDDAQTVGRRVLVTLPVVRELSWRRQVALLFDDMHLVWAGMGASAATLVCVAAALGLMRLTLREQPASMKAMIVAMADPGSNRNPLAPDGRLLMPTASLAGMIDPPMLDREDALVAFAAVVTREGTIRNLELLLQDAGQVPVGARAIGALFDAVSQTRFEPARALTGAPVAVNMVWLVAQTRVRGKTMTLVPMPLAVPVGRSRSTPTSRAPGLTEFPADVSTARV